MRRVDVKGTVQLGSAKKEEGRDGYPGWFCYEQIKHRVRETTQGLWGRRRQRIAQWLTHGLRNVDGAAKRVRDWYKTTKIEKMESEGSLCYMFFIPWRWPNPQSLIGLGGFEPMAFAKSRAPRATHGHNKEPGKTPGKSQKPCPLGHWQNSACATPSLPISMPEPQC